MKEYGYVKVEGTAISDAMKKLDKLWDNIAPVHYDDISFLTKDNPNSFFYSGAYYGAFEMAKLLFRPDFEIICDIANGGKLEHRLEVVDETDLR